MIKNDKLTYKVSEENEDPKLTKIEKRGLVVEFCLDDVLTHEANLKKFLTEVNAKISVEKAKMDNIEHNHEFIKELTDEQVFACYMYQEAKIQHIAATEKLEEINTQMMDYATEKKAILEQTGIKIEETTDETNTGAETKAE